MEKIKAFWNFTLIPIFYTVYYICRYGLEGGELKADEELARLTKKLIELRKVEDDVFEFDEEEKLVS